MKTPSTYIHGTEPEEQERLTLLNGILNEKSLKELQLGGSEKILDVGCGLAQFTRMMARTGGSSARVVGIERDQQQIREARRQADRDGETGLIEIRQGDAFALPLADEEWGSFDLAHTRFLLEHVSDPLPVVTQMVRAVRPGGRIVLEDDNHDTLRLWPEPPGIMKLWRAYMKTYTLLGNDPLVGHRLVSLLSDAGAQPVRNTWIFFGSCAGDPSFPAYVTNLAGVLDGASSQMVRARLATAASIKKSLEHLRNWSTRPDAAIWFSLAWAEGKRPNHSPTRRLA